MNGASRYAFTPVAAIWAWLAPPCVRAPCTWPTIAEIPVIAPPSRSPLAKPGEKRRTAIAPSTGTDKVWTEEIKDWPVTGGYYSLTLGLATAFGDVFVKNGDLSEFFIKLFYLLLKTQDDARLDFFFSSRDCDLL